ncbi:MAG: PilZ domain-containing protein [Gammaproteobacteria bacterium]
MFSESDRPYRKNITSQGIIYMGEEEHDITIKNLSINGALVELHSNSEDIDIKYIFNTLLVSTILDLYLPEMRLAGEAEVTRVDMDDDNILLALEFKNMTYDVDQDLNKRKAYRKIMPGLGKIVLNNEYREFTAVNVSVEGLMICLAEPIKVKAGTVCPFEFKRLELEGEAKVIWSDIISDNRTLLGLQYVHMENKAIKGIPRFARQQTA